MSKLNLKRLFQRKNSRLAAFAELLHKLDPTFALQDADGTWLVGATSKRKKYPVEFQRQVMGWVTCKSRGATFAALINQILIAEAEAKALGNEALGLYREINLLFNLSEHLAVGIDVSTVAQIGLNETHNLIRATHGAVILLNDATQELECAATLGNENEMYAQLISLERILREVIKSGKSIVVNDAWFDPRYPKDGEMINALVCAPLRAKKQSIGAMVLTVTTQYDYTAGHGKLLNTIASLVGPAIDGAMQFEKAIRDGAAREERLKQESDVKSALIGVITHEMRSPFASADLSVQLLRRYLERQMYAELQEQIEQLDRELASGRKMIDNVVSFVSLVSRRSPIHLTETNIGSLIYETLKPLEKMAETRNIEWGINISPELPYVLVDHERLSESVYHLVHNAIKFNHDGGRIQIGCYAVDKSIEFVVQDTGVGIPQDKLASIWEGFTQTADGMRRGMQGLGIGLALVKLVIEMHGGTVHVTSELGKGSTFGFQIPVDPK